jgi:hypothetical protein
MTLVPGRTLDEKVLRLAPRVPTPLGAARLLAQLASDLEGKRASDRAPLEGPGLPRAFAGVERRLARAIQAVQAPLQA